MATIPWRSSGRWAIDSRRSRYIAALMRRWRSWQEQQQRIHHG
jgi:hypothetical protein